MRHYHCFYPAINIQCYRQMICDIDHREFYAPLKPLCYLKMFDCLMIYTRKPSPGIALFILVVDEFFKV